MSDGTRQKLTLPSWHTPYLEKHKILELFHVSEFSSKVFETCIQDMHPVSIHVSFEEIAREIVIQQPTDHLMFTKQLLQRAAKNIGVSRVLMLHSPTVHCLEVANLIAQKTKQIVITEDLILTHLCVTTRDQVRPGALAMCLASLLRTDDAQNHGWILVDCIKTAKEAKKVVQIGVMPTHVLHLIPPFDPPLRELLYCNVHETWPEYRRDIMAIREIFKNKLVEIFLLQRFIGEVVNECVQIIRTLDGFHHSQKTRLLLIGPRGSGRNTQAKCVSQKLNLVHVDFQYILCQTYNSGGNLGEALRKSKDEVCYHSELLTQVVNQRILKEDCLEHGWVLTGYPFTISDFKYLDLLDTPPNRVIFLECDLNICRERLINRRVNMHTGCITDIVQRPECVHPKFLKTHPKDEISMVNAELNYYCEQYGELRNYAGETAQVINADQQERWITECILAFIARETITTVTRNPSIDGKKSDDISSSTTFIQDTKFSNL